MDKELLQLTEGKKICHVVFRDTVKESLDSYFRGIREPEEHYEDLPFSFSRHDPSGSEEFNGILSADEQRESQEQRRYEYVEKHKGNLNVNYEFIDKISKCDNTVISFDFDFNIGDIVDNTWPARRDWFVQKKELWGIDLDDIEKEYKKRRAAFAEILNSAEDGTPIFLWHGERADEICGYQYLVCVLMNIPCTIVDVALAGGMRNTEGDDLEDVSSWAYVPKEEICAPFSCATIMSEGDKQSVLSEWGTHRKHNTPLRVYEDGIIKDVEDSYYDELILSFCGQNNFRISSVVARLLETGIEIDYMFWNLRIFKMIEEGKLEYVIYDPGNLRPFECWLRKPGGRNENLEPVLKALTKGGDISDLVTGDLFYLSRVSDTRIEGKEDVLKYIDYIGGLTHYEGFCTRANMDGWPTECIALHHGDKTDIESFVFVFTNEEGKIFRIHIEDAKDFRPRPYSRGTTLARESFDYYKYFSVGEDSIEDALSNGYEMDNEMMRGAFLIGSDQEEFQYIRDNCDDDEFNAFLESFNEIEDSEQSKEQGILLAYAYAWDFIVDIFMDTRRPFFAGRYNPEREKTELIKCITDATYFKIPGKYETVLCELWETSPFIETLEFEEGVKELDGWIIRDTEKLRELIIPASMEHMGVAFVNCPRLEHVEFKGKNTPFNKDTFSGCAWYENLEGDFIIFNDILLEYRGNDSHVFIPEGVRTIRNACWFNDNIQEITVPNSVKTIESFAFAGCDNLKTINLPEGLETIAASAFDDPQFAKIYIPESVTSMGIVHDRQWKCFSKHYEREHPDITIICKRGSAADEYAQHFELKTEYIG